MTIKYFHLPVNGSRFGGTSLGYVYLDEKKPGEDRRIAVTFARCSENDVFSKEKSRLICAGRMRKGKFKEVVIPAAQDKYEYLSTLAAQHDAEVKAAYGTSRQGR